MGVRLFSQVANDRRGNGLQYHHERLRCWKKISLKMCSDNGTNFPGKKLSRRPWRYFKKSIDAALRDLV